MQLSRGDIVLVVSSGDYGKPRPAVVVQADIFNGTHSSVSLCLITSELVDAPMFRIALKPLKRNGLKVSSQVMVDKIQSARRDRMKSIIGVVSAAEMREIASELRHSATKTEDLASDRFYSQLLGRQLHSRTMDPGSRIGAVHVYLPRATRS